MIPDVGDVELCSFLVVGAAVLRVDSDSLDSGVAYPAHDIFCAINVADWERLLQGFECEAMSLGEVGVHDDSLCTLCAAVQQH